MCGERFGVRLVYITLMYLAQEIWRRELLDRVLDVCSVLMLVAAINLYLPFLGKQRRKKFVHALLLDGGTQLSEQFRALLRLILLEYLKAIHLIGFDPFCL